MKGFCPLASGSRGNSIYFGTEKCRILIDAGISTKALRERLATIDVPLDSIDAIIISHEHRDHIEGLRVAAFRMGIPVFANSETAKGIVAHFGKLPEMKIFTTGEPFKFHDIKVHPFSVQHDTLDPVAFILQTEKHKIGICTDLGFASTQVKRHLQHCDYLYLEANHDPEMLHASARPERYKQRVLGRSGHLSNQGCAELLQEITHPDLKHVHLAHLSGECNSPEKAVATINQLLSPSVRPFQISVAPQDTTGHPISWD